MGRRREVNEEIEEWKKSDQGSKGNGTGRVVMGTGGRRG